MDTIICECNLVTRGEIIEAIKEKNLKLPEEVTKATGASNSCGRCRRIVRNIIKSVHEQNQ